MPSASNASLFAARMAISGSISVVTASMCSFLQISRIIGIYAGSLISGT